MGGKDLLDTPLGQLVVAVLLIATATLLILRPLPSSEPSSAATDMGDRIQQIFEEMEENHA